jgi:hypothetical protein
MRRLRARLPQAAMVKSNKLYYIVFLSNMKGGVFIGFSVCKNGR